MATLDPGAVLAGRYRVVRAIGEGGMGAIYEAIQLDLNRRVAIKVLHSIYAAHASATVRFRQEALAAAALGHPNIVRVTDFVIEPGQQPFLVMELLESGQTLRDVLRAGPLEPKRAAYIGCQILSALEAAHQSGLVHRDVKPENVFLSSRGVVADFVTLLDFGIAKMSDSDAPPTQDGQVKGTVAYMAPEQASNGAIGPWTDVYGVGATLYRALTGVRVFERENVVASLHALFHEAPKPVTALAPHVPAGLSDVILRALAKAPGERPPSAAAMEAELMPFARGELAASPVAATLREPARPPASPADDARDRSQTLVSADVRPAPPPRRGKVALVLAAALLLLGGAVGVTTLLLVRHTPPTALATDAAPPPPSVASALPSATTSVVTAATLATGPDGGAPEIDAGHSQRPSPFGTMSSPNPGPKSTATAPSASASVAACASCGPCADYRDCERGQVCTSGRCAVCPPGMVPAMYGPVCKKRCAVSPDCAVDEICDDMALVRNTLVCTACPTGTHRPANATSCN